MNKKIKKRGQTAIEFVIIVGFVLFFMVAFLAAVQSNINDKLVRNRDIAIKDTALTLVDEINLAHSVSDGYYRNFTLPNVVANGVDYKINVTSGTVYIITNDGRNALALSALNVTGQPRPGKNSIIKNNGIVCLNKITCP